MGYSLWPPTEGTNVYSYEFWAEWRAAMQETAELVALGYTYFPATNQVYWTGIVSSCTATTFTDADAVAGMWATPGAATGGTLFHNLTYTGGTGSDHVPQYYDVIFSADIDEQKKYFRAQITANDDDGNLTFSDITAHRDIYKQISSFGDLDGERYWFVERKGTGYGLFWHDRWMTPPSGVQAYGSATAVASGELTDDNAEFAADTDGDIILLIGGSLARRSISGIAGKVVSFSGGGTPDGGTNYYIVPSGAIYLPGTPSAPARWYSAATESYVGLSPSMEAISIPRPAANVTWSEGLTSCELVAHPAKDRFDLKAEFDDQCSKADKYYAPDSWKSPVRASQVQLEGWAGAFVENKDYDGELGILQWNSALAFEYAAVNQAATTGTPSSGSVTFSVSVPSPYASIAVHYSLYDHRLRNIDSGTTSTSGTITFNSLGSHLDGQTLTLVTSRGWDRRIERTARYIYSREWLTAPRDEEGEVISTPTDTEDGAGVWTTAAADSHNTEYDDDGFPATGLEAFANGQQARYVAHRWCDGIIDGSSYSNTPDDFEFIKWAEFQLPESYSDYRASRVGGCVGGSAYHLDSGKSWWTAGTLRTEMGTATGGSTTTLSDSSKSGSYFWNTATGRWVSFILEVEVTSGVWEARPVTGHAGTTLTVAFAFSVSTSGKNYRLKEPEPESRKNRWKARKVTILHDGDSYTRTVSHSDDFRLFWADALPFAVTSADTFSIDEIEPGEVVERVSGEWERVDDSRAAVPDILTRYGRARKFDLLCPLLFQQLYDVRNAYTAKKFGVGWTANGEENVWGWEYEDVLEYAYHQDPPEPPYVFNYADAVAAGLAQVAAIWASGETVGPSDLFPTAFVTATTGRGGIDPAEVGIYQPTVGFKRFAYMEATGLPTWRSSVATFYCMGAVNRDDDDETSIDTGDPVTQSDIKYDDNGTDMPYRVFKNFGTVGGTGATRLCTALIGGDITTQPVQLVPPDTQLFNAAVDPTTVINWTRGTSWAPINECTVLDFTGSMEFLPP